MIDCVACGLLIDEEEIKWYDGEPHCEECYIIEKYEDYDHREELARVVDVRVEVDE